MKKLYYVIVIVPVLSLASCSNNTTPAFTEAVRKPSKVVFYQGLPRRAPEKKAVFEPH